MEATIEQPRVLEASRIDPNGVYSRTRLAAVLGLSVRQLDRVRIGPGFPAPFVLSPGCRRPYWRGYVLLEYFDREQEKAIEQAKAVL